jgi:enterochelin esterase-like enzyme
LDLETIGDGRENPGAYDFTTNREAVDEELFHDVVPFVEAHYSISYDSRERAIAGLAFSPSPLAAFSHEVQDALEDPIKINKINKSLCLFAIVAGDKDLLAGSEAEYFDSRLRGLKIQHVYTVIPGTHSMFVWRPALSNFLQEIFKH